MTSSYEIRSFDDTPTPGAIAEFSDGSFIQYGGAGQVASYLWSYPSEGAHRHWNSLLSKTRLAPGIGHLFISNIDGSTVNATAESVIAQVSDPALEPAVTEVSCRFSSGVAFSCYRENNETRATASALYFNRHTGLEGGTPAIEDLVTITASFEVRRAAKLVLSELIEIANSVGPELPPNVIAFKRPGPKKK